MRYVKSKMWWVAAGGAFVVCSGAAVMLNQRNASTADENSVQKHDRHMTSAESSEGERLSETAPTSKRTVRLAQVTQAPKPPSLAQKSIDRSIWIQERYGDNVFYYDGPVAQPDPQAEGTKKRDPSQVPKTPEQLAAAARDNATVGTIRDETELATKEDRLVEIFPELEGKVQQNRNRRSTP